MRRPVWRAVAACLLALTVSWSASAQVLKLATLAPDGSVWDKALKEMAADWRQLSGGTVTLRIYPGGVAGDDADIVRKMRIGQIHAGSLTVAGLGEIDEAFNVLSIPLFYDSYEELFHIEAVMEPLIRSRLEAKGFVLLQWGLGGWAHLFSTRPVHDLEDLKRLKLYTWAGDQSMVEWWKRNGFQPVPLAMTDILTGLQTGMIDVVPTTPLAALSLQWFRQTPYMHELGLAPVVAATIVTRRAWERIPEAIRERLLPAARRVEETLRNEIPGQDLRAVEEMVKRGLIVTATEDEAAWRREAQRFAETMRGSIVPAEIFDRARAARDAFRRRASAGEDP